MRHFVTSCLLAVSLALPAAPASDRLELRVKLDPAAQKLEVEGSVAASLPQPDTREFTWLLNGKFEVTELKSPQVASWSFTREPGAPEAGALKVLLRRPLGPADRLKFRIRYRGTLALGLEHAPAILSRTWTELGRSLPWFPLRPDNAPFSFRLEVQCRPEFALASYGPFLDTGGRRTLAWDQPVTDLVLVAAPRDRMRTLNLTPRVRLVSTGLGQQETTQLAQAMTRLMATLQRRLGPRDSASMTLIQALRPEDDLRARPGLVILGGLDYARVRDGLDEILRLLAVETAHAWWCSAPVDSWEDWLNESFSEYTALLAVREVLGEPAYQRAFELKRRACAGLPPLWEFDRHGPEARPIMENKGVVLLAELEGFLGRDPFEKLCRDLATRNVGQTAQFLDLLEARAGKSVREAFQRRMMTL